MLLLCVRACVRVFVCCGRYGNRGVQAACFSSSGTKLAVVCLDNSHTL